MLLGNAKELGKVLCVRKEILMICLFVYLTAMGHFSLINDSVLRTCRILHTWFLKTSTGVLTEEIFFFTKNVFFKCRLTRSFKKHNRNLEIFLAARVFHCLLNPISVTTAVGCLEQLRVMMLKVVIICLDTK